MEMIRDTHQRFALLTRLAAVDDITADLDIKFHGKLLDILVFLRDSGSSHMRISWLMYRVVWETTYDMFGYQNLKFDSPTDIAAHGTKDQLDVAYFLGIFSVQRSADETFKFLGFLAGHEQPATGTSNMPAAAALRPILGPGRATLSEGEYTSQAGSTTASGTNPMRSRDISLLQPHPVVTEADFPTYANGEMSRTYTLPPGVSFSRHIGPYKLKIRKILAVQINSPAEDKLKVSTYMADNRGLEGPALKIEAECMFAHAHQHLVAYFEECCTSGRIPDISALIHGRMHDQVVTVTSHPNWRQEMDFGTNTFVAPPEASPQSPYYMYYWGDENRRKRARDERREQRERRERRSRSPREFKLDSTRQ